MRLPSLPPSRSTFLPTTPRARRPETRLDVAGLPRRVRAHVARAGGPDGLTVDRVESDGRQVVVAMSSPLRLPFLSGLATDRIRVESRAQLAYRAGVP